MKSTFLVGIAIQLFLFLAPARASETGDALLRQIDTVALIDNAHILLDVTVTDARGRTADRTIEVWQQGSEHRLVRILAPTRLRGIGLLVSPGDTVYLFLPEFPPARRVVGNKRSDAFMGTDFAIDDLARLTYADRYYAEVASKNAENGLTELALTPIDAKDGSHVKLWVADDAVVRRVVHFNAKGDEIRILELSDVRENAGALMAHTLTVTDVRRHRQTKALIQKVESDVDLSPELFTVSNLERQ